MIVDRRNVYQGTCCNQKRPRPSQETRKEDHQKEMDRQEAYLRREKRKGCKEQRSFPCSTRRYERIIHFYITSEKCKTYNDEIKYNDEILQRFYCLRLDRVSHEEYCSRSPFLYFTSDSISLLTRIIL